jgi:phospholipase C
VTARSTRRLGAWLVGSLAACAPSATLPDAGSVGDAAARSDAGTCALRVPLDPHAADRAACTYAVGAMPEATLGLDATTAAQIPIDHVVIVMQENRSFDHYFGDLGGDVETIPARYACPDASGASVTPHHLGSRCLPLDPAHQWDAMHAGWDMGAMDGFVRSAASPASDGHFVVGTYDESDLPFYHWLARTFAISDRHFGDALGGTWSNRAFLYTGSSYGIHDTGQMTIPMARTIYDALDAAHVSWGVYSDGNPRQDLLGWDATHVGFHRFEDFLVALEGGALPAVTFVDPGPGQDEHPPNDVALGENWTRRIYEVAVASPLWPSIAIFVTYDESGGLFDHVPPPAACLPSASLTEFDRLGVRVPLIVVSPWARPGYVRHTPSAHTSILRFVELRFGLPALSARDANADALLDVFDFCAPSLTSPPPAPEAAPPSGC